MEGAPAVPRRRPPVGSFVGDRTVSTPAVLRGGRHGRVGLGFWAAYGLWIAGWIEADVLGRLAGPVALGALVAMAGLGVAYLVLRGRRLAELPADERAALAARVDPDRRTYVLILTAGVPAVLVMPVLDPLLDLGLDLLQQSMIGIVGIAVLASAARLLRLHQHRRAA